MDKQDVPRWTIDPVDFDPGWKSESYIAKIELVVRRHLKLEDPSSLCHVIFHKKAYLDALYKVETADGCLLMRIIFPLDSFRKTDSEISTINFLRQNTKLPVSKIHAFDKSSDNELGYEWILMDMLPGETLESKWNGLSEDLKRGIVGQIAQYQAQLFHHKFSTIGNIRTDVTGEVLDQTAPCLPVLGPIGQLVNVLDVSQGPFTRSEDWIRAYLTLVLRLNEGYMKVYKSDPVKFEYCLHVIKRVKRLLKLLPSIFPVNEGTPEQSVLFHKDLSMGNILIDNDGSITGIIDWNNTSVVPIWRSCSLPKFLQGKERNEKPKPSQASDPKLFTGIIDWNNAFVVPLWRSCSLPKFLQGKERNEKPKPSQASDPKLYLQHLREYELTQLRPLFLKEMHNIAPTWTEEYTNAIETGKADFWLATQNFQAHSRLGPADAWLSQWLDEFEKGENRSLVKKFLENNIPLRDII
ncbi:hypothetical protein NHQ30_005994 [Ciborinia camelliae]|nr:hypothetical protein NHQ30_005994 [Ciborinia camelliae]